MARAILQVFKWLSILAVVFALAFFIYAAIKVGRPLTVGGREKNFVVKSGQTATQVAENLKQENLISSPLIFQLYMRVRRAGGKVQAGGYWLRSSMSMRDIANLLVAGKVVPSAVRVTLIEGWTVADIGQALEDKGLVKKSDFVKNNKNREGYLFPDTYLFAHDATAEQIAAKMIDNFNRKVTPKILEDIKKQGRTLPDIVTLASIIEREAAGKDQRRLIAGVFYNRLAVGMALQSDATISYITGKHDASPILDDLKITSPYNTYKYRGLPPGPIGNPSLEAIEAAIYPTPNDYLYFVTDKDGQPHFAKTLAEHEKNKAQYLK